ncbi:hypothetical protein [Nostoc sp. DedQUE02]|uniref:hypothetical protein n=1 Tax=Nostoc sp. DedQUE02 TaxID=3075388 RepID=UPI002AD57E36|nr:hypothetical protein [Nostoc sp. DedQUE03]MDZ8045557.1 hypothetical protein [Nostoc sp. DedQUE02]
MKKQIRKETLAQLIARTVIDHQRWVQSEKDKEADNLFKIYPDNIEDEDSNS